jgi:hypothetical protein
MSSLEVDTFIDIMYSLGVYSYSIDLVRSGESAERYGLFACYGEMAVRIEETVSNAL